MGLLPKKEKIAFFDSNYMELHLAMPWNWNRTHIGIASNSMALPPLCALR